MKAPIDMTIGKPGKGKSFFPFKRLPRKMKKEFKGLTAFLRNARKNGLSIELINGKVIRRKWAPEFIQAIGRMQRQTQTVPVTDISNGKTIVHSND
jgi:hypothetical protein